MIIRKPKFVIRFEVWSGTRKNIKTKYFCDPNADKIVGFSLNISVVYYRLLLWSYASTVFTSLNCLGNKDFLL